MSLRQRIERARLRFNALPVEDQAMLVGGIVLLLLAIALYPVLKLVEWLL